MSDLEKAVRITIKHFRNNGQKEFASQIALMYMDEGFDIVEQSRSSAAKSRPLPSGKSVKTRHTGVPVRIIIACHFIDNPDEDFTPPQLAKIYNIASTSINSPVGQLVKHGYLVKLPRHSTPYHYKATQKLLEEASIFKDRLEAG